MNEVTEEDLRWWLDLAPRLEWTFAKTYADTAPHSYVVLGRTPGMTAEDFERAGRVIRRFGQPGKFYSMTNIYLTSADGLVKWWIMPEKGRDIAYNSTLINQASTAQTYGRQDAMTTSSTHTSIYDSLGVDYDRLFVSDSDLAENAEVSRIITSCLGATAPRTLDMGCGTGLLLDMKITHPSLYLGVDPSQGMLNELVTKHPTAKVVAATANEWLATYDGRPFDLVASLFCAPSYMSPEDIRGLAAIPSRLTILMHYDDEKWLPDWYNGVAPTTLDAARAATRDLLEVYPGELINDGVLGNFETVVLRKDCG